LSLPGVQDELARAMVETGKPVVVVLVNGRPAAIPWLAEHAAALLEAWLPGEEGAAAVADVLFGVVNPSGKLPISFPRTVGQIPVNYNHKPSGGRSHWYIDYVENPVTPLYPFGHGLSYTQFTYSNLRISPEKVNAGEQVEIHLTITNSGQVRGSEVVQLYICDEYGSIPRPVKELKGFAHLTLEPGESSSLTFHLPVDLLAFYDENIHLVVEAGKIDVMLGSSSQDIRLAGAFEITGEDKTVVTERLFDCPVTFED
jgi:beta-glucosidase